MLQRLMRRRARLLAFLPLVFATSSFAAVTNGCGDITGTDGSSGGDRCTKGCKCGKACIDCSKQCHKFSAYYWGGAVPDSLKPR
jgi:hypothetical protein